MDVDLDDEVVGVLVVVVLGVIVCVVVGLVADVEVVSAVVAGMMIFQKCTSKNAIQVAPTLFGYGLLSV